MSVNLTPVSRFHALLAGWLRSSFRRFPAAISLNLCHASAIPIGGCALQLRTWLPERAAHSMVASFGHMTAVMGTRSESGDIEDVILI